MRPTVKRDDVPKIMRELFGIRPLSGARLVTKSPFGNIGFVGWDYISEGVLIDAVHAVLHATEDEDDGDFGTSRILRIDMKLCGDEHAAVLDIDRKPHGFGIFMSAHRQYFPHAVRTRSDIRNKVLRIGGFDIGETVTLYSPRLERDGTCLSDDVLFSKYTIPWDDVWDCAIQPETPVIIRSVGGEHIPEEVWDAAEEMNLIMPRHEPAGGSLLRRYDAEPLEPGFLSEASLDGTDPDDMSGDRKHLDNLAHEIQRILLDLCDRHAVGAVIVKPETKTDSFRRRRLTLEEIELLTGRPNSVIKTMRRAFLRKENLIAQPYRHGIGEEEKGINHVIRMFFVKFREQSGYYPLGGYIIISDDGWRERGFRNTHFCLLSTEL